MGFLNRPHRLVQGVLLVACSVVILSRSSEIPRAYDRPQEPQAALASSPSTQRAVINQYCVPCHNRTAKTGGLALDTLDIDHVAHDAETWEKVVRKLGAGVMPPAGRPRPDTATYDNLRSWLISQLDRAAVDTPNPGRTEAFHRLNRAEFRNAVRDLLALDIDVAALLPADEATYGFDNMAGVQRMSPTLMERYLLAAERITRVAIGTPGVAPNVDIYRLDDDLAQDDRLEGLPFGTRGGAVIPYNFPRDGEYSIRVQLARYGVNGTNEDIFPFERRQDLQVAVDGEPVHVFTLPAADPKARQSQTARRNLDADWQVRFAVKAGPHEVAITFLNRTPALVETLVRPLRSYSGDERVSLRQGAYLRSVEISGPFEVNLGGNTPSRRRIFTCHPSKSADEEACARTILTDLARRAYRRPVTQRDLQGLMSFFRDGRIHGGFEAGIEQALQALLVMPEFLFRVERDPQNVAARSAYRINDLDLASRLSFFLWSSIPDDELLDAASRGTLRNPAMLHQQVTRMLADPRAQALVKNFAGQWLFLRNVSSVRPDPAKDPDFDASLRQAFLEETELFFDSIMREDRSVLELLTADYTFVNERLARHYGIPGVMGTHFRRVTLTEDYRRGLLGQGSVLAVTAYPHRTSPVLRGKWILENFLGMPPPPPPPNVPDLKETNAAEQPLTMRERMAQHRANPACASCHAQMDPLGFALENFDFVGRWRTRDESFFPIDASGSLPDGTTFDGVVGLRQAVLKRPDQFVSTMTEKLLAYALGRGLEYHDAPAIRTIVRAASRDEYRFSTLILGIVESLPFQMKRSQS